MESSWLEDQKREGDVMDTSSRSALARCYHIQRLIKMILLPGYVIGIVVASLLFTTSAPAYAAGNGQTSMFAGAPPTPTNLNLQANSDSSITISWTASPGATGYHIYRGTSSGGEGATPIATTTVTT